MDATAGGYTIWVGTIVFFHFLRFVEVLVGRLHCMTMIVNYRYQASLPITNTE